jgi:penicillin-binding protein 2
LVNGAVGAAYPPGSTFDVVTGVAALETGVVTATKTIDCPGFITVPNRFDPTVGTRLADGKVVGTQDIVGAIATGCDVFFYEVGGGDPNGRWDGVGAEGLGRFAHLFGLGESTGIDLAEDVPGLVPTVRWKRQAYNQEWVPMDTYQFSVGAGYVTATPLQMANVAATIANGGTLYQPHLVLGTSDNTGALTTNGPDVVRRLSVKSENLGFIRRGMIAAMRSTNAPGGATVDGASRAAAVDGWSGGGVVSSVEYGVPDAAGKLSTHGWFVGFAPAEKPTIALAVFLENGSGEVDAARIAHDVLAYYQRNVTPSP